MWTLDRPKHDRLPDGSRALGGYCDLMTSKAPQQNSRRFSRPIRVMVVNDHPRVREGLRVFLSMWTDIDLVAEAGSGAEAPQRFAETSPDVVVMDLTASSIDTPALAAQIKAANPDCQIIALACFADAGLEQRVLEAGSWCSVVKDSSAGALVAAIQAAYATAGLRRMTFVQAKTGASADPKAGVPSDGKTGAAPYDCPVSEYEMPATKEVSIG